MVRKRAAGLAWAAALGTVLGAGCGSSVRREDVWTMCRAGPEAVALEGVVNAPMPLAGGLPFVDVKINGCGPYRMVIDSGSEIVCLTPAVAHELQLAQTVRSVPFLRTGRVEAEEKLGVVEVGSVEIGACEFRGVHAIVREVAGLSTFAGARVDGVIGCPLLRGCVWTLDYSAQRLTLSRDGEGAVDLRAADANGSLRTIEARCDGTTLSLLLDTGSVDVLSLAGEDLARLRAAGTRAEKLGTVERWGFLGSERLDQVRIAGRVSVGGLELDSPIAIESRSRSLVGSGALAGHRVMLDFQRGRARIEAVAP